MKRIQYVEGRKYELKDGEDTPFNPDKLYVYLNDEMFTPVESEREFNEILKREGLLDLIDED